MDTPTVVINVAPWHEFERTSLCLGSECADYTPPRLHRNSIIHQTTYNEADTTSTFHGKIASNSTRSRKTLATRGSTTKLNLGRDCLALPVFADLKSSTLNIASPWKTKILKWVGNIYSNTRNWTLLPKSENISILCWNVARLRKSPYWWYVYKK